MTRRITWAALLVASVSLRAAAGDGTGPSGSDAKAAFDRLKSLVGDWQGQPMAPNAPAPTMSYRLTGNGTALMGTQFAGTPHEMVTVFHLAGDELVLTHYCPGGTQPRMKLVAGGAAGELRFDFAGGDNVDLAKGTHMHGAVFPTIGKDRYEEDWTVFSDGKATTTHKFVMTRAGAK
jgi:hypothetical protein